jgi:hypothetical protein
MPTVNLLFDAANNEWAIVQCTHCHATARYATNAVFSGRVTCICGRQMNVAAALHAAIASRKRKQGNPPAQPDRR